MLSFKKTNEPTLRKLTDRWKDGRTDAPYFIGPFQPRQGVQKLEQYVEGVTYVTKTFFGKWKN